MEILGPARAPWEKIRNRYRYQMVLKASSLKHLRTIASKLIDAGNEYMKGKAVKITTDVDPVSIM